MAIEQLEKLSARSDPIGGDPVAPRGPFHARADQSVLHHSGIQECMDESQQTLDFDVFGDPINRLTFVEEQRKHRQTILRRLLRLASGLWPVGGVAYLVFLALVDRPINQTHRIPQATISVDKKQAIVPADQKQSIAPTGQKQAMIPADQQQSIVPAEQKQAIAPADQKQSIITNDKQRAIIPEDKQEAIVPDKQQAIATDRKQQATISSRSMHDAPKGHCWARWSRDRRVQITCVGTDRELVPADRQQPIVLAEQKQAIAPADQKLTIITNDKQQAIIPDDKQNAIVPDKQQAIATDDKQQATISRRFMHDAPKGHCWARWSRSRRVQITCVGTDRERPRR